VQGPLYDYLKSLGVTQPIDPELAADIDALVLARVKAEITSRAAHAPIKPPLPELTPMQIQAVIRRGKERPWSGRAAYHSDPRSGGWRTITANGRGFCKSIWRLLTQSYTRLLQCV
jgi:hypothetical protein